MAAYNKFQQFVEDLAKGLHVFGTNTYKLGLTATSPNAADTDVNTSTSPDTVISTSNAVEIASGNGYTEGGTAITTTTSAQSSGTFTWAGNQVVFTASGGAITAFRYLYVYNTSTGAAGTRPLVCWFDYGASLTLNDGETLTVKFNSSDPGTIFTLA